MTAGLGRGRHLSTATLTDHWAGRVPVLLPLDGAPRLHLLIDGGAQRLALRTPVPPEIEAPAGDLANVRVEITVHDGVRMLEVSTLGEALLADGYAMLCAVADRIQLEALDPVVALTLTLETWREILALRGRMSPEREVGLFGELLLLEALVEKGGQAALDSWCGPGGAEHDFSLSSIDVEVKTTSTERREHWIGGLAQLTETGARPLFLVSLQITRAGSGGGRTLPELIDVVADRLHGVRRATFGDRLAAAGWRDAERRLVTDRWRLRSEGRAYRVDDDFPRITAARLAAAGLELSQIREVRYVIDLTDAATTVAGLPPELQLALKRLEPGHA